MQQSCACPDILMVLITCCWVDGTVQSASIATVDHVPVFAASRSTRDILHFCRKLSHAQTGEESYSSALNFRVLADIHKYFEKHHVCYIPVKCITVQRAPAKSPVHGNSIRDSKSTKLCV
ncbi:hypothetical protein BKA63DRAFT_311850 [Paraphoma chrysanthemicola]|nr:hypothetical protein BKA63DRAFT_311850 [Paraphoma chrysanthemicola]